MSNNKKNDLFEIEKIVDRMWENETKQYLYKIKWVGYPDDQSTWEPKDSLKLVPSLLKEFNESYYKIKSKKRIKKKASVTLSNQKSKIKGNQLEICSLYGDMSVDIPSKIIGLKKENNELVCLIEWENKNKVRKLNSIVKHKILKEKYPLLLLSFYEERIIFKK